MFFCHQHELIQVKLVVSCNGLVVVLVWSGREVGKWRRQVLCALVSGGKKKRQSWPNRGDRLLPETGHLESTDALSTPSAGLRCTPGLWRTTPDMMFFCKNAGTRLERFWSHRSVFPKSRPGRTRWSCPAISPTRTPSDVGCHRSREDGDSGFCLRCSVHPNRHPISGRWHSVAYPK